MTAREFCQMNLDAMKMAELKQIARKMAQHYEHKHYFAGYTAQIKKGHYLFCCWLKRQQRSVAVDEGLV